MYPKNDNSYYDLPETQLNAQPAYDAHEIVRRFTLPNGLVAYVAVHNTNLGPALGGLRFKTYPDEAAALNDVLRLSKGMTYKNAMAGLPLGGGKAVIIGDPKKDKTEEVMRAIGAAVETLEGAYVTAEDSGTTEEDMTLIAEQTDFVTGLPALSQDGFEKLGGNPSPLTALGCYHGIVKAVHHVFGESENLKGKHIAVQGVGAVGLALCKLLEQDGAALTVCDISDDNLKAAQAALQNINVVAADKIYDVECDVFAPCAMGGVLNDDTISRLQTRIIAGAANNQLLAPHHDRLLFQKHIVYVPDYVINAGGVICVGYEFFQASNYNPKDFDMDRAAMVGHVEMIGKTVNSILARAQEQSRPTGEIADRIAEERFGKPMRGRADQNIPASVIEAAHDEAMQDEEEAATAAPPASRLLQ